MRLISAIVGLAACSRLALPSLAQPGPTLTPPQPREAVAAPTAAAAPGPHRRTNPS